MSPQALPYDLELGLTEDFGSASVARRFTAEALARSRYNGQHHDVVLVVSELVANALLHGHGAPMLRVRSTAGSVRIEVRDGSPVLPSVQEPGAAGGGMGLYLVNRLVDVWGASTDDGGKVVWCEMSSAAA